MSLSADREHGARRHPLCTCLPVTFIGPAPDRAACAGGTIAHPVVTMADVRAMIRQFQESGRRP